MYYINKYSSYDYFYSLKMFYLQTFIITKITIFSIYIKQVFISTSRILKIIMKYT